MGAGAEAAKSRDGQTRCEDGSHRRWWGYTWAAVNEQEGAAMTKTYTKDTLTREVLERGVKLRVIDEQHSAAFQRACFGLNVFWPQGEVVQYTGMPFLFVGLFRGKHSLKYSSVLDVFDS